MLSLAYCLAALAIRAHAVVEGDSVEFRSCFYFSLLGLFVSLAFLRLAGPSGLMLLAAAG